MSRRSSAFVAAVAVLATSTAAVVVLVLPTEPVPAKEPPVARSGNEVAFETLLERHRDLSFEELRKRLPEREFVESLSFDPSTAKHFDLVVEKLELTEPEVAILKRNGFVSSDQRRRHGFSSAYYAIYTSDLPVLVTSDSILHAVHRSYSGMLQELERSYFRPEIEQILADAHELLGTRRDWSNDPSLGPSVRDVDLFLTVARRLVTVPSRPKRGQAPTPPIPSRFGVDADVATLVDAIKARQLQTPDTGTGTAMYGGRRHIDFSQFEPRGYYRYSEDLSRYFECMMWLGRPDCGWNVLSSDPDAGLAADVDRELRNAVLLVQLLEETGGLERLRTVDGLLRTMVGRSDNLTPFATADLLRSVHGTRFSDLRGAKRLQEIRRELRDGDLAGQRIRSQVVVSYPGDLRRVPPPAVFQVLGQRFVLDSFVLSHQVFDSIIADGRKQMRMMPSGLDVAAALGNDEAVAVLEPELRRWRYSGNLLAARDYVAGVPDDVWQESLYNGWLDALRHLDDEPRAGSHVPEVMRTRAWQRKQLQTQLASWAELRRDTLLYAKQSFTAFPGCEYPEGYVEPYPRFYARLRAMADHASRMLRTANVPANAPNHEWFEKIRVKQIEHFDGMSQTLTQLEAIAERELRAEPFTEEQAAFLERVIDQRGNVKFGSGSKPRYDGWYPDLIYGDRAEVMKWVPTIADVHTDPKSQTALEVGTGDVNLGVVVIDNDGDLGTYVGPFYSYYEFTHPVSNRLADPDWEAMLRRDEQPARPAWTADFQGPPSDRPRHARPRP